MFLWTTFVLVVNILSSIKYAKGLFLVIFICIDHHLIVQEKAAQVQSFAGETILRGDEFKRYVTALREKSNIYKGKKADISDLKAEYGVLERTIEILRYCQYITTHKMQYLNVFPNIKRLFFIYQDIESFYQI